MEEDKRNIWKYLQAVLTCSCYERNNMDTELIITKPSETVRSRNKTNSNSMIRDETKNNA